MLTFLFATGVLAFCYFETITNLLTGDILAGGIMHEFASYGHCSC